MKTDKTDSSRKQNGVYSKLLLLYWKEELRSLSQKTGVSLEQVSEYIGVTYKRDIGFYAKIPRRKNMIIGIGMAYKLSLDEINRWLTRYAGKSKLYAKDVFGELAWIYLINCNYKDRDSDINYFRLYERCIAAASATYQECYREVISEAQDTETIARELCNVGYDREFNGLRGFVIDHMGAFQTAYTKPRKILKKYVKSICSAMEKAGRPESTLSALRGFLDDSMINYLSGSTETVHAKDLSSGRITEHLKMIPKSRKEHIALCLALGMASDEINEYLRAMGYTELDPEESNDRMLLKALDKWDDAHPLQRQFKACYIAEDGSESLSVDDDARAAEEMLLLRQSLKEEYTKKGEPFPYISN